MRMKYPADWTYVEQYEGSIVAFVTPKEGEDDVFPENVLVLASPYESIEPVQSLKKSLSETIDLTDYKQVEVAEITVNGNTGFKHVYTYKAKGYSISSVQYGIYGKNKMLYQLIYSARSGAYNLYLPKVEEMVKSFEVTNT